MQGILKMPVRLLVSYQEAAVILQNTWGLRRILSNLSLFDQKTTSKI